MLADRHTNTQIDMPVTKYISLDYQGWSNNEWSCLCRELHIQNVTCTVWTVIDTINAYLQKITKCGYVFREFS